MLFTLWHKAHLHRAVVCASLPRLEPFSDSPWHVVHLVCMHVAMKLMLCTLFVCMWLWSTCCAPCLYVCVYEAAPWLRCLCAGQEIHAEKGVWRAVQPSGGPRLLLLQQPPPIRGCVSYWVLPVSPRLPHTDELMTAPGRQVPWQQSVQSNKSCLKALDTCASRQVKLKDLDTYMQTHKSCRKALKLVQVQ